MPTSLTRRDAAKILAATASSELLGAPASDICFLSARKMAALIRAKKLSAREALAAHLKQIERVNPKVNAIVTLVADQAMETARQADEAQAQGKNLGPLHGLPVVHKDLFETAGIRTTFGSLIFKDNIPKRDAIIAERITRAGAVTVGKSNTPEFGTGSQTFNAVFGSTKNPYDLTKTCGGSSGGAAVSLACGMVPIADGSDSGGSLRNPASFCNVVGIRPSPGRVPAFAQGNAWLTISVQGPMARTVSDVAYMLSVIAGPDPRCPISIEESPAKFAAPLGRNFKGVRVAWFKNMGGIPFEPRVLAAVNAQRSVFENLGCIVEQAEPDWTGSQEGYDILRAWNYGSTQAENLRLHRDLLKDTNIWEAERGAKLTGADVARGNSLKAQAWENMRAFQEKYEFFVCPTCQVAPYSVDQPYPSEIEGVKMSTYIEWQKSCILISGVENPAISVPCGFTLDGLPVGIQIVGRHRDEWGTLQLGHGFEQATNIGRRRPAIVQSA